MDIDFISAAGHKFHGPKGVGILYVNSNVQAKPLLHGGGQERNMRAGTENLYGIVGFARALELAMERYEQDSAYIKKLKAYMTTQLLQHLPGIGFNGDYDGSCLYTVLNTSVPQSAKSEMLLFNLDIHGICVSGGSACSSGASQGSHVINALKPDDIGVAVRFSFCKYNTMQEVDKVVEVLTGLI
jgi:cysteine desulfurase